MSAIDQTPHPMASSAPLLHWHVRAGDWLEAVLGSHNDGLTFTLRKNPTFLLRGPWELRLVCLGDHWPTGAGPEVRYYHLLTCGQLEAEAWAAALVEERLPSPQTPGQP